LALVSQQVAAQLTPYDVATIAGAFVAAYTKLRGPPPSQASWLMPLAQAGLETAKFAKLFNNNVGNMTHVPGDGYDFMQEYPGSLQFRVYPDLQSGVDDMMRWLNSHGALNAADRDDLDGYTAALKSGCYVGCGWAGYPAYEAGIGGLMRAFAGVAPAAPSAMSTGTALLLAAGILLAGAGVAYVIHKPDVVAGLLGPAREGGEAREASRHSMNVQSLLFKREDGWTESKAKRWAKTHGYRTSKVDVTDNYIRLRQREPRSGAVKRTKTFGRGIKAIVQRASAV
jgi:hypothetical protein